MKEQLIAELARTRQAMTRDCAGIKRELDYKAKLEAAVRRKPFAWFGGAAIVGWMLAGPKTRTKHRTITKYVPQGEKVPKAQVAKSAGRFGFLGIILTVIRLAFPLVKPALSNYALRRLSEMAEKYAK